MSTITIVDETTAGTRSAGWHLEIFEEELPLTELIKRRIFQEVAEHNARGGEHFHGLVQPTSVETVLNGSTADGSRNRKHPHVDAQTQYDKALEAFGRNGFLILVDDRQVTELNAVVSIKQGTEVTFLKLVPLVGG
ncbi:hypothetical protein [Stackebrandtia soli]|uniref:hypothetical protein n=1 Tax=Stackebrandtia soli TaxID=1892856 RepID=UPI0039EA6F92